MTEWSILSRVARRSIRRHWRYSLGAFLSVVAGFLSLSLFRAYMADVAFMYEETYTHRNMDGNLFIEKAGSDAERKRDPWAYVLDEADQAFLEKFLAEPTSHVKERVRFLIATGMISNGTSNSIFWAKGYDIQAGARMRGARWEWDTAAGTPLQVAPGTDILATGKRLARTLECDVPIGVPKYDRAGGFRHEVRPFSCPQYQMQLSVTTAAGQLNAVDAALVGIVDGVFQEIDSKFVMMPLPLMQRLFDTKGVTRYAVELRRPSDIPVFLERLQAAARPPGRNLRAMRWEDAEEGDLYLRTMELLGIFRNFVISIMIGITGLSVFNAFLKSVNERTREIGTLRSLGYRRSRVMALFGLEATYLSVAGCLVGLISTLVLTKLANAMMILYKAGMLSEPIPFRIAYDLRIYLTSAVFLLAVGIAAAVLAVRAAVHRPIAENLIHT